MKFPRSAWFYGSLAVGAGALVNCLGDLLLGVRLEYFYGVYTFSPLWIVDLFLVPFIAGIVVSLIFGLGGKLLCYLSPIIVRGISYYDAAFISDLPEGAALLPIAYWVMVVIVAVEAAAFGGVAGEIVNKKIYGRRPRHLVYKSKSNTGSGSR